jgi:hypothetical protein
MGQGKRGFLGSEDPTLDLGPPGVPPARVIARVHSRCDLRLGACRAAEELGSCVLVGSEGERLALCETCFEAEVRAGRVIED